MGTWGASLYEDDEAGDLKNTLAVLCKVPVDGDRLLEYLEEIYGDCDPATDEGVLFWLVTADQFERRGVECKRAAAMALGVIESGSDLSNARDRGADEVFLKKRALVLQELAQRLKSPRKTRTRIAPRKAPDLVFDVGEVYAFRTMNGYAWQPHRLALDGPFEPDGWGALIVLATGRAFDWLPWVALASLTVSPQQKPALNDALQARLIFRRYLYGDGPGRYIPKRAHAWGMGLEPLGRIQLEPRLVTPHLSKCSAAKAIQYDWPVPSAAMNSTAEDAITSCELSSLVKAAG